MSTLVSESPSQAALVPGKKYRFHAKTAEEAVRIIHERMGPKARVVAVEQLGGQGLGRLLGGSKLEVVAMIPPASLETAPETPSASPQSAAGSAATPAYGPGSRRRPLPEVAYRGAPAEDEAEETKAPETSRAAPLREYDLGADKPLVEGGRDLRSILRRLGFSAALLADFASSVDPRELAGKAWAQKLDAFVGFLWQRYRGLSSAPATGQIAFLGTPGSGISTALCKELTASVFLREEQPLVSTLELEQPNSVESLRAFCELMQVPLVTEERAALAPTEQVFWDVPGIPSRDFETWRQVGTRLDDLGVRTRVFVSHAAFDSEHLLHLVRTLECVRPTHVVLSHLDEAHNPARLWDFLLACGCSPLFASDSPSVTGGRRDDFHAALLAQTFPAHLNLKS